VSAAKRGAIVLATDLTEEMVAVTRRRAAAAGVKMDVRVMDIENMDVPDGAFDAVTCRFGLMFCPNLQRAASQVHRAIKPGGHFAFVVWDEPAKNPFFTVMGQLVQKYLNTPPPDPTAPGPLRLGAPGEFDRVLRSGGFTSFKIEAIPLSFTWDSPEAYWDMQSELAAPLKAAIAKLPADQVTQLRGAVLDVAKAHIVDGKVRFGAQPLIAFGVR
jgi:SAM-dependent methyltransferase